MSNDFWLKFEKEQSDIQMLTSGNVHHAAWRQFLLDKTYHDNGKKEALIETLKRSQLLYWNVIARTPFGSADDDARGFLVEVFYSAESRAIFMLGARYVSSAAYHGASLFDAFPFIHLTQSGKYGLTTSALLDHNEPLTLELDFSFDEKNGEWSFLALNAHSTRTPRQPDREKILWNCHEGFPCDQKTHIPCPHCYGRTGLLTFAIPKENWNKGLSGYGLYSENRVSGWIACKTCGGEGATYQDWFIADYPEQCASSPCIPGKGCVPYKPLPLLQSIET